MSCRSNVAERGRDRTILRRKVNGESRTETRRDMRWRSLAAKWADSRSLSPMDLEVDDLL